MFHYLRRPTLVWDFGALKFNRHTTHHLGFLYESNCYAKDQKNIFHLAIKEIRNTLTVEYINSRACMQRMHLKISCFVKLLRTRSALLSMQYPDVEIGADCTYP